MKLSKLASEIAESPTFALNEEARQLRERGEPVINLGIGEPKNKTPTAAVIASASKLPSGDVKYFAPDGVPSLKKAIIRYTEENYDRLVAPENVIITMEVVKVFVALKPGCAPSDELELEIMNTVRRRLSPLAMPQAIEFVDALPKTRSGKILRRVLRAQEWGEPVGDLSTMMED